jgi:hypothetical protein
MRGRMSGLMWSARGRLGRGRWRRGQIRTKASEYRAGREQEAQVEADFFRQIQERRCTGAQALVMRTGRPTPARLHRAVCPGPTIQVMLLAILAHLDSPSRPTALLRHTLLPAAPHAPPCSTTRSSLLHHTLLPAPPHAPPCCATRSSLLHHTLLPAPPHAPPCSATLSSLPPLKRCRRDSWHAEKAGTRSFASQPQKTHAPTAQPHGPVVSSVGRAAHQPPGGRARPPSTGTPALSPRRAALVCAEVMACLCVTAPVTAPVSRLYHGGCVPATVSQ